MRTMVAVIGGIACGFCLTLQVLAQDDGTCEHPLGISGPTTITLDTRRYSDLHHSPGGCAGSAFTGPDIVIDFGGGPASGVVTWDAGFDAVLWVGWDECDSTRCMDVSTSGTLRFDCGYEEVNQFGPASWNYVYIVVDGIDGAAGMITLTFDFGYLIPTRADTWGRLKETYREAQR